MDTRIPAALAVLSQSVRDHQDALRGEAERMQLAREGQQARPSSRWTRTTITAPARSSGVGTIGGLKS